MYDPASDEPPPKPVKRRSYLGLAAAGVLAIAAGAGLERSLLQQKQTAARPITPAPGTILPPQEPAESTAPDRILAKASPDQKLDIGLPEPPPAERDEARSLPPAAGAPLRFSLGAVEWQAAVPEGFQPAAPDWGDGAARRGWRPDDGWVRPDPKGEVRLRLHAYFTGFLCRPYEPLDPPVEGRQEGYRTLSYRANDHQQENFVLYVNEGTCIQLTLRSRSSEALQAAMPAFLEAQRSLGPAASGL